MVAWWCVLASIMTCVRVAPGTVSVTISVVKSVTMGAVSALDWPISSSYMTCLQILGLGPTTVSVSEALCAAAMYSTCTGWKPHTPLPSSSPPPLIPAPEALCHGEGEHSAKL